MSHCPSYGAVVLGLGFNGLALVRSLGRRGVEVGGVHTGPAEFGRFSRYCHARLLPQPAENRPEFVRRLILEFGDRGRRPLLLAQSDEYVSLMSAEREQLRPYFRFLLADAALLEALTRKELSTHLVEQHGLVSPRTVFLRDAADVDTIAAEIEYPCLMKPVDSHTVDLGEKTLTFDDHGVLREFVVGRPELMGRVIVQEIVPGGDENTFQATTYVSADGTIQPIFTMRKVRQYPPDFGIASYGIGEEVPAIAQRLRRFVKGTGYRGLISTEFKKHPRSGEWFYIETNPRLPYYHSLIHDSGINYPYIYYRDMFGGDRGEEPEPPRTGVRWICFSNDLGAFARKRRQGRIGVGSWLASVVRARSFSVLDGRDPLPFLAHVGRFVSETILGKVADLVGLRSRSAVDS